MSKDLGKKSIEEDQALLIESAVDKTLDGVEKLPSTANIDSMALSAAQGWFADTLAVGNFNDGDVFEQPSPGELQTVSQKAMERNEISTESDSYLEKAQFMAPWMSSTMASLTAKTVSVGYLAFGPLSHIGLLILPGIVVAASMPDPLDTVMFAERRYFGKNSEDEIELDYEVLRDAIQQDLLTDEMFGGDLYKLEWDDLSDLEPVDADIEVYGTQIEEYNNLDNLLKDVKEVQNIEENYPIMLEKGGMGKIIIPSYEEFENLEKSDEEFEGSEMIYSVTPALEITYSRDQNANLPDKPENYDLDISENLDLDDEDLLAELEEPEYE